MTRRRIMAGLPVVWAVLGLLAWVGCDDAADPCVPAVPGGKISGQVRTGGLPLEAVITVVEADRAFDMRKEFKAETDAAGNFAVEVPTGRYTIELTTDDARYYYAAGGAGDGSLGRDTVVVDGSVPVPPVDFDLGSLTLRLELPGYLFGQPGELELHRVEDGQWSENGNLATRARTQILDGQLELTVIGVLPGQYKVEVGLGCQSTRCRDFKDGERFWVPGVHDPGDSPLYSVRPDSHLVITSVLQGEPSRIEGRVTGAWLELGFPWEPVVSIVAADSGLTLREIETDPDGGFSAGFLVPGPVKLLVTQGGVETWVGGSGFVDATVFHLEEGRDITGIEYAQCGLHLLTDPDGPGGDLANILVFDRADGSLVASFEDWDTGARHAAIPNLLPGEYLVRLTPNRWNLGQTAWRPQWYDRATTREQAPPVILSAGGEVARLDVVLEPGGEIAGRIYWDIDADFSFYMVLYDVGQDTVWAEPYFFGRDDYRLTGLPDGDYALGVAPFSFPYHPSPGTIWYPDTADRSEAAILEIREGTVLEGVDIVVPATAPAEDTGP